MKPTKHIAISFGVSLVLWFWVQHLGAAIACFLSGVLIDLDHHLDYLLIKKELPLDYRKLVAFCANIHSGPLLLIFHSYELIALFWLAIYWFHLSEVWLGLALGVTVHLVCDQFANPLKTFTYFTTYRLYHHFDRKKLFKANYEGKVF